MSAYQQYLEERMPMGGKFKTNRPQRQPTGGAGGGGGGGFNGEPPMPSPGLGTGAPAPFMFEDQSYGYPGMHQDPVMALLAAILNNRFPNSV